MSQCQRSMPLPDQKDERKKKIEKIFKKVFVEF